MTKKNFTSIVFVLDKSSSMTSNKDVTISSFNEFVQDQQNKPGECTMTLVQFDTEYNVCFVNKPIAEVETLEKIGYAPGGMTALIDATARAINEAGDAFNRMKEKDRPSNVVLVILTDGEENSSREVKRHELMKLIEHQVDRYDWKVVYLGQGAGAWGEASRVGLTAKSGHSNYYVAKMKTGARGMMKGIQAANYAVGSTRSSDSKSMDKGGTQAVLDEDEDVYQQYRNSQSTSGTTGSTDS